MSIYFDAAKSKLAANLSDYRLIDTIQNGTNESAVFTNDKTNIKILYSPELKRFFLFRGEAGCAIDDYSELQSYFFEASDDEDADLRDAASVANEFTDTLGATPYTPVIPAASRKVGKKDRDNDETSAVFFVNRIPTILPECRNALLQHKAHYDMLLPNNFCEEVVNAAVDAMLKNKSSAKGKETAEKFFEFLSEMYSTGDLDVKSIITITILNHITGDENIEYVEELLSADLIKAWKSARHFIGKDVKPEKVSKYKQMSNAYREQLQNQNR